MGPPTPTLPHKGEGDKERLRRIFTVTFRAKTIRMLAEVRLKDQLRHQFERHLHDPIPDRGDGPR
jgi:hypothetical protein